jgi:hypothetical protein
MGVSEIGFTVEIRTHPLDFMGVPSIFRETPVGQNLN